MSPDKLVMMANQIGRFFASQPGGHAVADIANHLRKFWEPRMRAEILAYAEQDDSALDPPVREAVQTLRNG